MGPTELHWFLEDADDDPEYDTPCYALQGQHLVLSTSTRLAEETLKNLKRPGRSLAQSKILQSMARQVHDGDVTLVVEADPIRKVLMNLVPDKNKYQAQRALDVLGVQQLQGILASFQFRLQGQEVLNMQTLLATDGPPQGIFAIVMPRGGRPQPQESDLSNPGQPPLARLTSIHPSSTKRWWTWSVRFKAWISISSYKPP